MPAASLRMKPQIEIRPDVNDFSTLFGKSSEVPEKLRAQLRARIRGAAEVAAADVRRTVLEPPLHPGQRPRSRGLREQIAAGIKVSVSTASSRPGVVIKSSAAGLDPSRRRLVRAYDLQGGWRHPVFADSNVWVRQVGRPYFATVIEHHRGKVTDAVQKAMQDAAQVLIAGGSVASGSAIAGRLAAQRTAALGGSSS